MKQILLALVFLLFASDIFAQASYSGLIDKYPIELATDIYSDGDARAVYAYKRVNEPIPISGKLNKGRLVLYEKDKQQHITATLTFDHFDVKAGELSGTWTDAKTQKMLPISLSKDFDPDGPGAANGEIMQSVSLKDAYFKLLVAKMQDGYSARATGLKILDRKTNKLIQQLDFDCELRGLDNVSVGDYNFDGIMDIAVFESSYAGPNTSSLYFLYDPATQKYFDSGFSGVSLEFDSASKTVSEHNQCCAGRQHTTAIYKIKKNKMVLKEEHCYIWDEKKQDLIERKMKDCQ